MSFEVYLIGSFWNDIQKIIDMEKQPITVSTLVINDGLLKKGDYYVPIDKILFIKEV